MQCTIISKSYDSGISIERYKIMEVPYQREEEEEVSGVDDLLPRRKSKTHYQKNTNYNSSSSFSSSEINSTITSESSADSSISFEDYTQSMNNNTYTNSNSSSSNKNKNNSTITITRNGENPQNEGNRSEEESQAVEALSQADEEAGFQETKLRDDYINGPLNQDSHGFTAHQNGNSAVGYSAIESNGGDKEADIGSDASKSPEAGVDLKDVENLSDERADNINVMLSETYNIGNIVNKTVIVRGQNEIVETGPSQGDEPITEYEVEKVVKEQTTHDFFCPNCKSCITDRVILKRRKRKVPEITTDEELKLDETLPDVIGSENVGKNDTKDPSASVDAISCFSCFSIFVPKGDGFLWWRFNPKSDVLLQSDGSTPVEFTDPETSPMDVGTGKSFPLWFLTCCQPNHIEKPVLKPGPKLPPISEDVDVGSSEDEVPFPPTHDGSGPRKSQHPTVTDPVAGNQLQDLQQHPPKSPRTDHSDRDFPLWFLGCCQPSTDAVKPKPPKSDTPKQSTQPPAIHDTETTIPPESQPPVKNDQGIPPHATVHDSTPSASYLDRDPSSISEPWTPSPKPLPVTKPDADFPISTEPKPPTASTEGADHVLVSITVGPHCPEPPDTQPNLSESALDTAVPLLSPERPRPGVSGLDIIKAIVYGGLVECITSLSVISSAAGGDATTLNIVALGLANVFGGLIVLLHNIRVLHHEHTVDRYVDQLGRLDYYVLHAVVAVLSYLIFGLLSPVIYGFTFRKSDNKNYKLATLAAVSLVCITFLSIGKAYVRRNQKKYKRTIIYFISLGFTVSGVGYVAGNLINMLLIKLGVFDSNAPVAMPGLETDFVRNGWSSY